MDKTQFQSIAEILVDGSIGDEEKITKINAILGTDISDRNAAKVLKEKVVGNDTMEIEREDGNVTVRFSDTATTGPTFGIAFIATLMNVINDRAIASFLPEPKQAKTKSGSKRDGLGSPAPTRSLPIRNGNY